LWTANDHNEYTIRSGYKILNQEDFDESVGSLEMIWNIKGISIWISMHLEGNAGSVT